MLLAAARAREAVLAHAATGPGGHRTGSSRTAVSFPASAASNPFPAVTWLSGASSRRRSDSNALCHHSADVAAVEAERVMAVTALRGDPAPTFLYQCGGDARRLAAPAYHPKTGVRILSV